MRQREARRSGVALFQWLEVMRHRSYQKKVHTAANDAARRVDDSPISAIVFLHQPGALARVTMSHCGSIDLLIAVSSNTSHGIPIDAIASNRPRKGYCRS